MSTKRIELKGYEEALSLFGQYDHNLHYLERNYGVQIFARSNVISVRGKSGNVERAVKAIHEMRQDLAQGKLVDFKLQPPHLVKRMVDKIIPKDLVFVTQKGTPICTRSTLQKKYVEAIQSNDLVISIGPAGTGKTFLAVAMALSCLEKNIVSRIILSRPVVEAGEKLGFLPGDLYEKTSPYLKPLYDAFYLMIGVERFHQYRTEEIIEIVPLAYMRGRTLDDAFIILDEAQNTTPEQMKMFLTRMGLSSRVVVTGDITQIDLNNKSVSGLVHLTNVLKDVSEAIFVYLGEEDVVRHPLVRKIIRAYHEWEIHNPRHERK